MVQAGTSTVQVELMYKSHVQYWYGMYVVEMSIDDVFFTPAVHQRYRLVAVLYQVPLY